MKPITALIVVLSSLILISCARFPDKLQTPGVKASIEIRDNKEVFVLTVSAAVLNENGSTIFKKAKGRLILTDPKEGRELASLPFEMGELLPMAAERLELKQDLPEKQMMVIIDALGGSREEFIAKKEIDSLPVDEKSIKFAVDSYEKKNIIEALREKTR